MSEGETLCGRREEERREGGDCRKIGKEVAGEGEEINDNARSLLEDEELLNILKVNNTGSKSEEVGRERAF